MARRPKTADQEQGVRHQLTSRGAKTSSAESVPGLVIKEIPVSLDTAAETEVALWETNDGLTLRGYRAAGFGWLRVPGVAVFRFSASGPVVASPDGGDGSRIESVWLSSLLPLVLQARGTQVLHASAVVGKTGIVVLCGVSGAGKSTLAAALMQRGHTLAADDALPFRVQGGRAYAYPLPFSLRLRPEGAALLGLSQRTAPATVTPSGRFNALVILVPRRTDTAADAAFEVGSLLPMHASAELVGELVPHLYCFSLAESGERLARDVLDLAASVPVFQFEYRHHPEALTGACETLEALLER
jgi:hypothetical protein